MINRTLQRKLKIEHHECTQNYGAPEKWAISAPLVAHVMLLLNETNSM